jgi:hypothetical protein
VSIFVADGSGVYVAADLFSGLFAGGMRTWPGAMDSARRRVLAGRVDGGVRRGAASRSCADAGGRRVRLGHHRAVDDDERADGSTAAVRGSCEPHRLHVAT